MISHFFTRPFLFYKINKKVIFYGGDINAKSKII